MELFYSMLLWNMEKYGIDLYVVLVLITSCKDLNMSYLVVFFDKLRTFR